MHMQYIHTHYYACKVSPFYRWVTKSCAQACDINELHMEKVTFLLTSIKYKSLKTYTFLTVTNIITFLSPITGVGKYNLSKLITFWLFSLIFSICRSIQNELHLAAVSWCFESSQPQRITSGLNTNCTLSPSYSFHKSSYHKSSFFSLFIFCGHSTGEPASSRVTYFMLLAYSRTMC